MLTRQRRLFRLVVMLGVGVVALAPATAAFGVPPGCRSVAHTVGQRLTYSTVCDGDEPVSTGGPAGGSTPTCARTASTDYCIGTSACWANVPAAAPAPEAERPSPTAIYTYQSCDPDPTGTLTGWSWAEPDQQTVEAAAQEAFGALATPVFSVGFNPPRRAVVNIPTWFWAQGAGAGEITGSSALGVVAIGSPGRLEVDPGDGSGVQVCAWSVSESDACSWTYLRSSARAAGRVGELPAYTARARLVYEVRFTNGGAPLVVAGIPATLESKWQDVSVPVAEIQSLVTATHD